ncbi:MAG: pirin family protein [Pyrinomonadaceae bacterium]|nr:pirin family protein [Blastocatellia bacterium]MCW5958265.1 pirin family protein [Pyrinomonadaceae bacterium]
MNRTVDVILPASKSFLPGDFVVHRALPRRELRRVGGFVFLDHFDQPNITPELFDVPPHPHVGLQTVTYLYEGEIFHTDSLDYQQKIYPGDVNWMTSGRGITHSEQVTELQPRVHGLQSWVGLPHDNRKTDPAFDHFSKDVLPKIDGDEFSMTVIAGEIDGKRSPIPTYQDLVYIDIRAAAGTSHQFGVNPSHELAVYVAEGEVRIGDRTLTRHDLGKLSTGDMFGFDALSDSKFVLIGGEPLPEPTVIYWNFITDTIGEAKQRLKDWEDGEFAPVNKYRKISSATDEAEALRMELL